MTLVPGISPEQQNLLLRDLEHVLELEHGSVKDPEVGLTLGGQYFAALARRPAEGADRLAAALAVRLQESLDLREFTITVDGELLGVAGAGGSMTGIVGFALRLPFPADERLALALQMWARDVAEFVTRTRRPPWPAPCAEARVSVDPDFARVWWAVPSVADPVLELRPFGRAELGL